MRFRLIRSVFEILGMLAALIGIPANVAVAADPKPAAAEVKRSQWNGLERLDFRSAAATHC
jgi:hypothetical protein